VEWVGVMVRRCWGCFVNDDEDDDCIDDDNDEVFVRILRHGQEPARYDLVCLNEKTTLVKKEIKNTAIKFAAPIVWIRRIFRENNY